MKSRKGFSLVEMLVVIGIIAVLSGAGMASFNAVTKRAQKAKAQELVSNVATALTAIYQKDGCWPRRILANGGGEGELTPEVAYDIASEKMMALTTESGKTKTVGLDRLGIVSPWARDVLKRRGNSATESTAVPSGGTIRDHRLRYAVDTDGKGYVNASVGGQTVKIRGSAAVWCCGRDGELERYSVGLRKDDVYSWNKGQVVR